MLEAQLAPGGPSPSEALTLGVRAEGSVARLAIPVPEEPVTPQAPDSIYKYMPTEQFQSMDGNTQELALMDRLMDWDLDRIDMWRRDMKVKIPLTQRQIDMSRDIDEVTKSEEPIRISYDKNKPFSRIWARVASSPSYGGHTQEDVRLHLEVVRLRRAEHRDEPNSDFYTNFSNLGEEFPTASMYFGQLYDRRQAILDEEAGVIGSNSTLTQTVFISEPTESGGSYFGEPRDI